MEHFVPVLIEEAFAEPTPSVCQQCVHRAAAEDRNLLDVAWAMAASARFREESRGIHYRLDFPRPDDRFRGHTMLVGGALRLVDVETPVPEGAPC